MPIDASCMTTTYLNEKTKGQSLLDVFWRHFVRWRVLDMTDLVGVRYRLTKQFCACNTHSPGISYYVATHWLIAGDQLDTKPMVINCKRIPKEKAECYHP